MLSAIARSMITAASVTFSLASVALSLAAQQFGSRVLRNFMRDRITQVVLGTLIATFVYCLLSRAGRSRHGRGRSFRSSSLNQSRRSFRASQSYSARLFRPPCLFFHSGRYHNRRYRLGVGSFHQPALSGQDRKRSPARRTRTGRDVAERHSGSRGCQRLLEKH